MAWEEREARAAAGRECAERREPEARSAAARMASASRAGGRERREAGQASWPRRAGAMAAQDVWVKRARAHPQKEDETRRSAEVFATLSACADGGRCRREVRLLEVIACRSHSRRQSRQRRLAPFAGRQGRPRFCALPPARDLPARGCARASDLRRYKRAEAFSA